MVEQDFQNRQKTDIHRILEDINLLNVKIYNKNNSFVLRLIRYIM